MWVARLKVWHANSYTAEKTARLNASYLVYNLNAFEHNGETWIARVAFVSGPDADKLIEMFYNDTRLVVEQVKGRQVFFSHLAKSAFHHGLLDKHVFFLKPNIAIRGEEYWTVASYRKKNIQDLVEKLNGNKKVSRCEMLSLKPEPVDVFEAGLFEHLTDKQKWAYQSAFRYGYYRYPREHDVEEIAKKLGVPESTFREHLRKAESKLLSGLHTWLQPENEYLTIHKKLNTRAIAAKFLY
ncbi:helix-turn-helix domain-containing protein [Candidatus Micrarchaeota archaeon]|nr:helix-turn-helix domain-containing protein [Candidatus Micrarchaeota archaeon]